MQEKEFETLPEAWNKLDEAYGRVSTLAAPLQTYPDLEQMTPTALEGVSCSRAPRMAKGGRSRHLKNPTDRVKTYGDAIFWHELRTVRKPALIFRTAWRDAASSFPRN